ncbi:MAG: hypothetical protein KAV41_01275 [Candidatus Pacebacteria bacterium]|nr:hypothetical protein [Candidatus Paceibacterota bacterium]
MNNFNQIQQDSRVQKNKRSGIERLKKSLYKRKKQGLRKKIIGLRSRKFQIGENWEKQPAADKKIEQFKKKPKEKMSFFNKLLVFSVCFFLVSLGVAVYVFYGGVNIISTENVDISINGPSAIGGGEELAFQVTIQNNNSLDLELADLIIEYPKGVLSTDGSFTELTQVRKSLGTIPAGGSVTSLFKSSLFGCDNDQKDIIVTIEYRAQGSNAIFFKERKYEVLIDSAPVGLTVNFPTEVTAGQEFEFSVDIFSNSNNLVKDFLVRADFPFGFDFKGSNLKPIYKDNVWELGDLPPNFRRTLKITGVLEGQDEEERFFRFSGGARDKANENEIRAVLIAAEQSIFIKKALIGLELVLNGDYGPEYITASGKNIRADILWSNNLPVRLIDGKVTVRLNGLVLNQSSVSSPQGFYSSIDNTILWDKKNSPQLELLNPGTSGNFSFSFSPRALSFISNSGLKNPEIAIEVTASGNRLSDNDSVEKVSAVLVKKVKINSDLLLTARTLYSAGSFENSGPIPPRADKETTYTIIWTVTNTANDISDARVQAFLPSYVRWLGVSNPSSENISFNQVGGEIIWEVGNVQTGKGIATAAKEVSFQVALLPSLSQVGYEPVLADDIYVSGRDNWTGEPLKYAVRPVTTRFSTEPLFNLGDEMVRE